MSELASLQVDGSRALLELNRPDARNALSVGLLEGLHARVDELAGMDQISVCVLRGAGPAFCAGMDLKEIVIARDGSEGSAADVPGRLLLSLAELTLKIRELGCVTVASVNGAAIGGGCGLSAVCDLAVTHTDSKMGYPEVDLGLCPAVVAPWLCRKIGAGRARAVLLRGGVMSGQRAFELGLVDEVCSTREELEGFTNSIAERLSAGGPHALAATKGLLNELDGSVDGEVVRRGAQLSAEVVGSEAAQSVLRARLSG